MPKPHKAINIFFTVGLLITVLCLCVLGIGTLFYWPPSAATLAAVAPHSSDQWASWIQAIGSIAAIGGSYWIGATQAERAHESAMAIYERQREDIADSEKMRKAQAKEESLIAVAAATGPIRRMQMEGIDLASRADAFASRLRNHLATLKADREKLGDAKANIFDISSAEAAVGFAEMDVVEARKALVGLLDEIDALISRLDALPRMQIAVARPDLAKLVVRAIHGLHNAAVEIEHHQERAQITKWLNFAEQALGEFGQLLAVANSQESETEAIRGILPPR